MDGFSELKEAVVKRVNDTGAYYSQPVLHLGRMIGTNLKLDGSTQLYPTGTYKISRTLKQPTSSWTKDAEGYEVFLPESLQPLKSGDRVLVAEIRTRYKEDFVIIDIL